MLKKTRKILAAAIFIAAMLLFLDFTDSIHKWLGWIAKIQFIPAVLAMNFGIVLLLVLLTLLFGRVYCSVICPLGIMQDIISWVHGRTRKRNRFRFSWSKAKNPLRYTVLALFVVASAAGALSVASLIEPYSAFGRIASNLFAPLYLWGNNLLAWFAEKAGSYAFYSSEVWFKGLATFAVAVVTFAASLISIILLFIIKDPVIRIFATSREGLDAAFMETIQRIFVFDVMSCFGLALNGAGMDFLLGLGKTRITLFLNFARIFLLRIPVLFILQLLISDGATALGVMMMLSNCGVALLTTLICIGVSHKLLAENGSVHGKESCI